MYIDYLQTNFRPFNELKTIRDQMDRFFENVPYDNMLNFRPNIDLFETENEVVVKADIPGIDPKNIEINVSENHLNIRGKIEKERKIEEENYHRSERRAGSFSRSITLPARVEHKKAKASTKHGVLEIKIPKVEKETEQTTRLHLEEE